MICLSTSENKILEEEIKSLKNDNGKLNADIKTQLKVVENVYRFENRHCDDSVTNKDKLNVNYESNNLKKRNWVAYCYFQK